MPQALINGNADLVVDDERHVVRCVTCHATVNKEDQAKGWRELHMRADTARLPAVLVPRLRRFLFRLQEAAHWGRVDARGFRLMPEGQPRQWYVRVGGNWRVVFRIRNGEAVDVDRIDYH